MFQLFTALRYKHGYRTRCNASNSGVACRPLMTTHRIYLLTANVPRLSCTISCLHIILLYEFIETICPVIKNNNEVHFYFILGGTSLHDSRAYPAAARPAASSSSPPTDTITIVAPNRLYWSEIGLCYSQIYRQFL